jgi:hypothetical protein
MLLSFCRQYLVPSVTALTCFTGVLFFQKQYYDQAIINNQNANYAQQETTLKAVLDIQKKIPSFGFDNLVADWNLLQYVQYFGENEARAVTGYPLITDYFEIIANKDPRFIQAFLSLSTSNSIFAGRPDKTIALMEQILDRITPEHFPKGYYIWTYKGVDEILFLGDLKAAENSYKNAVEWASIQNEETWDFMANRAKDTAQFLASNPDSTKVQVYGWLNILSNTKDEKTKQYVLQQVRKLGADIFVTDTGKLEVKLPTT